ncbi:polysaccharide deacetylase family protein [Paenibacillus woosongensis]|uniref:Polysaccharide deacetylase family protein n=1 Tax=Paenibacillus woosongensis TaxID=307580 RepID=A0AA95IEE6_9BACL|nr:polysaccharide deacetylase family protein [Paenibacillus woosongensis]WHX51138.1 polysaccharide deacetylase family protein [Paenibacillus woosongensis]
MYRNKLIAILLGFVVVIVFWQWGGIRAFVEESSVRQSGDFAFRLIAEASDDDLMKIIQEEAAKRREEPVDAVIDRVWKAIPGYNGIEVDIEKTYQKAKELPRGADIPYQYREVKPHVNLEDLAPEPIYRGNPNKPMVALMINVAWGNEYIVPMLDTLDEAKVKATFFLDGSWLKKNVEIAKEIQKRGHQLENHAYSHPNMSQLDDYRARLEISKTKDLLKSELNVDNRWFAPPSGDFDARTVRQAADYGLKTVLWTLDTVDWKKPLPSSIVQKISAKVAPGTLILMHPTESSSRALKDMIAVIREKGLVLGTVEETLSSDRVLKPGS